MTGLSLVISPFTIYATKGITEATELAAARNLVATKFEQLESVYLTVLSKLNKEQTAASELALNNLHATGTHLGESLVRQILGIQEPQTQRTLSRSNRQYMTAEDLMDYFIKQFGPIIRQPLHPGEPAQGFRALGQLDL